MPDEKTVGLALAPTSIPPAAATAVKKKGTVTADSDIGAMAKISKIINGLNPADRKRVIAFVSEKFTPELGK